MADTSRYKKIPDAFDRGNSKPRSFLTMHVLELIAMKLSIYPMLFLSLTPTLFAQSNRRSPGRETPASQATDSSPYYAREATSDTRVSPNLKLAAAYCLLHTLSAKPHQDLCWRRVKEALVQAGAVSSYPGTSYAYQAGNELVARYGFKKIDIVNPYDAPVGAVLVYKNDGETGGSGHVEFRTLHGFASDYSSRGYCKFKLTGVYLK